MIPTSDYEVLKAISIFFIVNVYILCTTTLSVYNRPK